MDKNDINEYWDEIEAKRGDIHRACARWLGKDKYDDLVLDAVQETMIRAHSGLHHFRAQSSVMTWVLSIAIRICIEKKSDSDRRSSREIPLESLDDQLALHMDEDVTSDEAITNVNVQRMYKSLKDRFGKIEILMLALSVGGMTSLEISERVGVSEIAVRKRLSRLKRKIRDTEVLHDYIRYELTDDLIELDGDTHLTRANK